jgi:predicted PurR-regulated permease PerM
VGARIGSLMGFGDLLGLLLAVPVASCIKTFFDAWRPLVDSKQSF